VDSAKRRCQSDGNGQDSGQIERFLLVPLDQLIQGFTPWVPENQEGAAFPMRQRQRLSGPCRIEFARQREFVFEPRKSLRRRLFDRDCQNRHCIAAHCATVESEVRPLLKRLQHELGTLCCGDHYFRHETISFCYRAEIAPQNFAY
jgi:hypothetical protein